MIQRGELKDTFAIFVSHHIPVCPARIQIQISNKVSEISL